MAIHEIVLNWQTTNGQTIVEVNHVNQPNDTDEALKIEQILAAYGLCWGADLPFNSDQELKNLKIEKRDEP
jgi:hypothetical protein